MLSVDEIDLLVFHIIQTESDVCSDGAVQHQTHRTDGILVRFFVDPIFREISQCAFKYKLWMDFSTHFMNTEQNLQRFR